MNMKFNDYKIKFDEIHKNSEELDCIVPVHLTMNKKETSFRSVKGNFNEQYYKWQFLDSFVKSGLCSKDYIGVEIQFPKGNKNSATIKLDGAIFDDKDWFTHYQLLWTIKDDSKWDELNWLKDHLLCGIEFKKEGGKDVKGVFNSQLKAYMSESTRKIVFGILYDFGRLYLFVEQNKEYRRLSDEFNIDDKDKVVPTFELPDAYENILSFEKMINYELDTSALADLSHRNLAELNVISKIDTKKINDALYQILHVMDKCALNNQKGYNILIQMLALKIYDEKHHPSNLLYYINKKEEEYKNIYDTELQDFLQRIEGLRKEAKTSYKKILSTDSFDTKNENQIKVVIEIVKQFQNYSFSDSKRNNLYQLIFYRFASQFSKSDNAQFVTPLQIIDFICDIINPRNNESIIDPTVGIADFLSISYIKSNGTLNDENIFGLDIDHDMVRLATLNMLLNGDGQSTIEAVSDGLGSIKTKFSSDGKLIQLIPKQNENNKFNYNGDWDNRPDNKELKKFDIVLTNPPFGKARSWEPKGEEIGIAQCYEL